MMDKNPATTLPPSRSAGAERMRTHRKRRKSGLRCLTILIRESEIESLVRRRFLAHTNRDDRAAVTKALYEFLDRELDWTPQ